MGVEESREQRPHLLAVPPVECDASRIHDPHLQQPAPYVARRDGRVTHPDPEDDGGDATAATRHDGLRGMGERTRTWAECVARLLPYREEPRPVNLAGDA
nr:hypothetical protein GCM10010200_017030 [Actinomadura rugatobispora]